MTFGMVLHVTDTVVCSGSGFQSFVLLRFPGVMLKVMISDIVCGVS